MSENTAVSEGTAKVAAVATLKKLKRLKRRLKSAKDELKAWCGVANAQPWGWKKLALVGAIVVGGVGLGAYVIHRWYTSPAVAAADVKAAASTLPV
jgi:hypothetical protein